LPFGLRSVGRCVAERGWQDYAAVKGFTQVFWTVAGTGRFLFEGGEHLLPEGHVFAYFVGDLHLIFAASPVWDYRFFTLDGPLCEANVRAFGLARSPRLAGPCPVEVFDRLEAEVMDITPHGQRRAAAGAFALLARAAGGGRAPAPDALVERCRHLVEARGHDRKFNVNALADELGLHRSRLSRLFHERAGVRLVDYIVGWRVRKGLELLRETALPVAEVAAQAGYASADYFAKAVKKATGSPPGRLREG